MKPHFISCSPRLIHYYLELCGTFQTLYWVQRVFDYCCCSEVSLGPPLIDEHFNFDLHTVFCRFLGVFGVYYSLQYLSLSDATVLTFLAPGAFFLGENFTHIDNSRSRETQDSGFPFHHEHTY